MQNRHDAKLWRFLYFPKNRIFVRVVFNFHLGFDEPFDCQAGRLFVSEMSRFDISEK